MQKLIEKADAASKKLQYQKLIADGDELLKAEKRDDARKLYEQASVLLPNDATAKQKIQEIDNFLNAKKAVQANYDKAIEAGDQFYINRDFVNARVKYEEALKIKPEARYPREMLDKTGKGLTQVLSDKERYDAAIASAEAILKTGDLEAALSGYRTALSYSSNDPYATGKIGEIEKIIQEKNSRKEAFDIAINNGDQSFDEKKYEISLGHYRNALTLLPDEKYPKERIETINSLLGNQKSLETNYKKVISEADARFAEKKYPEAIASYEKALKLKPEESYPTGKITEINGILEGNRQKNETYSDAIKRGDVAFGEKQYENALSAFKEAASIKTNEAYPKEKITAINVILAKSKSEQNKYDNLILQADKSYSQQNYSQALSQYQNASLLKPNEQYPVDRITAINLIMKDTKARQEMYTQAITTADRLYTEKQYDRALATYNEAKSIKPEETYPSQKINEINLKLNSIQKTESDYSRLIAQGDSILQTGNLNNAVSSYQAALKLKPAESYPKDQISLVNKQIADKKQLDEDYSKTILLADKDLLAKNYSLAFTKFEKASELKPSEAYPKEKMLAINQILQELKNKDELYADAITKGDLAFSEKRFQDAVDSYTQALSIKPAEKYPSDRNAEAKKIIAAEKALQDNYEKAISDADVLLKSKKYSESIAGYIKASSIKPEEKYPQEKIVEINKLLADQKQQQESYTKAVEEGDRLFALKDFNGSLTSFENAKSINSDESYPVQKIAEINSILEQIKTADQNYTNAIADGDRQLTGKNYQLALEAFKDALEIKSSEAYPAQKIKDINEILLSIKTNDDAFDKAILSADELFSKKEYESAIAAYQDALKLKPSEKYPTDQITEARKLIAENQAKQVAYDKAINEGENFFSTKKYEEALESFTSASKIKPGEKDPIERISQINKILDDIRINNENYEKAIADGDFFFNQKKFREALEPYERASTLKPEESYPKKQKEFINIALADQKKLDDQYTTVMADASSFKGRKVPAITSEVRRCSCIENG
ncbi:MAG: hypothetical protein IPH45_05090 [Bacteroidales bacterium]|nr:hypothetical protein [Bacteroidales bacterium]